MAKYNGTVVVPFEVEADTQDEAVDKAIESAKNDLLNKPMVDAESEDDCLTITVVA